VSKYPVKDKYQEGELVVVEAHPATGNRFDGWTGTMINDENPMTFSINQDTHLVATFVEDSGNEPDIEGAIQNAELGIQASGYAINYYAEAIRKLGGIPPEVENG
jgi:hypothetical protein